MNIRKSAIKPSAFTALACTFALATSLALTGCSVDIQIPEVDETSQDAGGNTGNQGNSDDDDVEFETNWADLPDGWPSDIPMVNEQISVVGSGSTPD